MPLCRCCTAVASFCSAARNPSRSLLCAFPLLCSAANLQQDSGLFEHAPSSLGYTHTLSMHPLLGYLFIYHPSLHPSCWQPAGPIPADEEICERRKRKIDCSKIRHNQYPRHLQTFQSQLCLPPAPNENLLCFRNDPSEIHQPGKTRSRPFSFRLCCVAGGVISVMALSWLSSSRGKVIMGVVGKEGESVTLHRPGFSAAQWRH